MKELVLIDNNARTRVADLRMRSLPYLRADTAMYDLLKLFQTGRSHMVVLTQPPDAADGSVSRANSQDVTVQIEEARERVSPEVDVSCSFVHGRCLANHQKMHLPFVDELTRELSVGLYTIGGCFRVDRCLPAMLYHCGLAWSNSS